jgi:predicted MPP superfamily phosphohydrolase
VNALFIPLPHSFAMSATPQSPTASPLWKESAGPTRRSLLLGAAGLTGAAGRRFVGVGVAEAATALEVAHYRPVPLAWPADRRLSITVIADLHAGGPNMTAARIREVVDRANALKSDIAVFLGDFVATHRFVTEHVPHDVWAAELARIEAPLGRWTILGNHDWWSDIKGIRAALAKAGIPVLENDAVLLGSGRDKFWLAGLGDQLAYRLGHGRFRGVDDLAGTLRRCTTEDPVILLVHEPDIFTQVPQGVALTLAGHTHGGQIRLPFVWPYLVPSAYGARFAYGQVFERGRHMIVSGGLGVSGVPMRLGVPPEIVRIELGA